MTVRVGYDTHRDPPAPVLPVRLGTLARKSAIHWSRSSIRAPIRPSFRWKLQIGCAYLVSVKSASGELVVSGSELRSIR